MESRPLISVQPIFRIRCCTAGKWKSVWSKSRYKPICSGPADWWMGGLYTRVTIRDNTGSFCCKFNVNFISQGCSTLPQHCAIPLLTPPPPPIVPFLRVFVSTEDPLLHPISLFLSFLVYNPPASCSGLCCRERRRGLSSAPPHPRSSLRTSSLPRLLLSWDAQNEDMRRRLVRTSPFQLVRFLKHCPCRGGKKKREGEKKN